MIEIKDKKDCCGCNACVQVCPKQCISMHEDGEGFLYPKVNTDLCINCHLCEKVCPVITQDTPKEPIKVYATKNPDETIRLESSSGGIFTLLAEKVIDNNGIVFGAKFNEHWEVIHDYTITKEGITNFRGSKYVQSRIGNTFKDTENFLKEGRLVLFSGTPCQIAGLKKFLRKEYDNLITVDFICHGVPSPGVFRWYLCEELSKIAHKGDKKFSFALRPIYSIPKADAIAKECGFEINGIRFRNKNKGWKKYSFALDLSEVTTEGKKNTVSLSYTLDKNAYLKGFLSDLYLRPSCHQCPTKQLKSGSDITIGDFWGISNLLPEYDDDRGISAVLVNTNKGNELIAKLNIDLLKFDFETLSELNPALNHSSKNTEKRFKFFNDNNCSFFHLTNRLCKRTLLTRFKSRIKRALKIQQ